MLCKQTCGLFFDASFFFCSLVWKNRMRCFVAKTDKNAENAWKQQDIFLVHECLDTT